MYPEQFFSFSFLKFNVKSYKNVELPEETQQTNKFIDLFISY